MDSNNDRRSRWLTRGVATGLVVIHAALLLSLIPRHSVTTDESAHIPSGLVHWHTGTYGAYRVNPPLPRMLATLPLLATDVQWVNSIRTEYPFHRIEWSLDQPFYRFNVDRYYSVVFLARLSGVIWSCLGAWLVYRWACSLYGSGPGLLALVLWCFEPNVLGHAAIVTPDVPCTVAGLLAGYLMWQYVRAPQWPQAIGVGLGLGLALLTKFTLLVLLPVGLILLWVAPRRAGASIASLAAARVGHAAVALMWMLLVINLGYLFHRTGRQLGEIPFISCVMTGQSLDHVTEQHGPGNRFRDSWIGRLPVPVPEDWLRGIDVQRRDFEEMPYQRQSYLAGEWRSRGWWYYYLYGFAVKVPVGTLVLTLAGLGLALLIRPGTSWRDELAIYLPGIAILALVSSQTGFNHHFRYALPTLPFCLVGASKLACWHRVPRGRWLYGSMVLSLACWSIASSLHVYPHCLSYFNEPAGGPENGHAHLVDSNIDWGQDIFFLKKWLDNYPEARPMGLAVCNFTQWEIIGQKPLHPPSTNDAPRPGFYAISVNALRRASCRGAPGDYTYFRQFTPIARAGYSIYIYQLTTTDCDQIRPRRNER